MKSAKKKTYARHRSLMSDPNWSDWTAKFLPDSSSGYIVQDCDSIIRDFKGNVMLLEIKRKMDVPTQCQAVTLTILDEALRMAQGKNFDFSGYQMLGKQMPKSAKFKLKYRGFYLLQIDGTCIINHNKYIDGIRVTNHELAEFLGFKKSFRQLEADSQIFA